MRIEFLAVLLAAAVCISQTAKGAEFIVSSASQISSVMTSQAHPGDTLSMTPGTWTNQLIVFKGNGTAAKPILLCARDGYGSVTLTGTSTLRIGGNYLIVDGLKFQDGYSASGDVIEFRTSTSLLSNYSRLTNSAVINYNPASTATDYKWISLYGTHNRVDHCYAAGKTHSGTTLVVWRSTTAADYHRIDHNYFGPRPEFGANGAETIRVGTSDQSQSSSFTIVESNYFEACNGEIEIISNKSCDNIYRFNTFVNCVGTLTLRHGNRCLVQGNFFFANRLSNSGGIRIIGEDHVVINNYVSGTKGDDERSALSMMDGIPDSPLSGYFQVKRAVVAFNTFVDNSRTITLGVGNSAGQDQAPLDCIIANNVSYTSYGPMVVQTDTAENLTWQHNLFSGASVGITPVPPGILTVNPNLSAVGADGLRRLLASSPAIDAAEGSFPQATTDMDGQPRDASPDAGADEYSAAPVVIRPLTVNDVGPNVASYTITVSSGSHGSISPGSASVHSGESRSFVIQPDAGYFLDSLIVDGVPVADSTVSYTFNNVLTDHSIRAVFRTARFLLSLEAVDGTISRNPELPAYDSASTVILTAVPDYGYHFTGWFGDAAGSANPLSLVIDANKSVTALFAPNSYALQISASVGGNVVRDPDLSAYPHGTHVQLTAVADSGWIFQEWEGDTSSTANPIDIVMFADGAVTAVFHRLPATRTVNLLGGWNLLSLPLRIEHPLVDTLFPSAASRAYGYAHSYFVKETLQCGIGFWLKSSGEGPALFTGVPVLAETLRVGSGWNLIGAPSYPVATDSISGSLESLRGLAYFAFTGSGYARVDTLEPGSGYWVKIPTAGDLYVMTAAASSGIPAIQQHRRERTFPRSAVPSRSR